MPVTKHLPAIFPSCGRPSTAAGSAAIRFALLCGERRKRTEIVLVHDAVRPLVTRELIDRVIEETKRSGAAIPALPAMETVKEVRDGVVVGTPDRRSLWNAQTPQGFRRDSLLEAFARQCGSRCRPPYR